MSGVGSLGAALAGCGLAAILFAAPVWAQDMQWRTSAGNDPGNKGRYTARLTHGIPETDAVQFSAVCAAGSSLDTVPAVLGYNTGNLREGDKVVVQFFAGGQQVYQKPGRVYGTTLEQGVSGVLFRPSPHDHFWQVLSRGGRLGYGIRGRETATISLSGSAGAIRQFTEACKAIATASNRPAGGQQSARRRSCSEFGRLKSVNSNVKVSVTFTNRTSSHRGVLWLDYNGRPVDYAALNAGQSYTQQTFAGHPWMLTDGPGNCKEIYVPQAGDTRFDITVE